jgi:hypothetical protein
MQELRMKGQPRSNKYRQLAESCAEWLAKGCGIAGTAAKHGISRETLYNTQEFPHFQELVESKREQWRKDLLQEINDNPQWTAKAWLLERVFREYDPPQVASRGSGGQVVVQVAIGHPAMQGKEQEQGQEQIADVKMVDQDA